MSLSKREYEDFKAAVDKIVYKYVVRDRSTILSMITHSVDSGVDKRKLEDKLLDYVDKSIAYKLADKVNTFFMHKMFLNLTEQKVTYKSSSYC